MIRTKQSVSRVLMPTRETNVIIRAGLPDGNVPCPAIASSIAYLDDNVRPCKMSQ
jgi:hypothetical protein